MPNTLAEVEYFAATHPSPHQGGTWNQKCEQFINNAGGFSQAFATAELAGDASGWLDTNLATAEPGEIHYWSGAGAGHDAFQTERGLLCASSAIRGYLGYISFDAFARAKPQFKYRGHTHRHGTQTLASLSTAGVGPVTPIQGVNDMITIRNVDGEIGLLGEFTYTPLTAAQYAEIGPLYPPFIQLTQVQHDAALALVAANRAKLPAGGTAANLQPILDAIAKIPTHLTGQLTT